MTTDDLVDEIVEREMARLGFLYRLYPEYRKGLRHGVRAGLRAGIGRAEVVELVHAAQEALLEMDQEIIRRGCAPCPNRLSEALTAVEALLEEDTP